MICPACKHEIPLTWGRYFSSPFGGHRCPQCGIKCRLTLTMRYILSMFGVAVVLALMFIFPLLSMFGDRWYTWLLLLLIVCILGLPLDRWFDEHLRALVPSAEPAQPGASPKAAAPPR